MGLAGTRTKQRFGLDPRNTAWSNDTGRFGHTMLEKFGWKPGMGLGMMPSESNKTHIKVSIKEDNVGLGAKIKRKERTDEFDNGECAGLDVFQRILGRLNGKEQKITNELEKQRVEKVFNGRWGVHFVKGEVLASTWDPETKKLVSYSNKRKRTQDELSSEDSDDSLDEDEGETKVTKKKHKTDKKHSKKEKSSSKKERKHKKDKSSKKDKSKKDKREKGHKKKNQREEKNSSSPSTEPALLESRKSAPKIPANVSSRLSVRARHIRQKRAATMDPKALNEIFMITDNN